MITFASIFLGLILGTQTIAVTVGDGVASVDLLVDGSLVATLEREPWATEWDFGDELIPRELMAVARDSDGKEIGRVRQWVNLPRQPAETAIVLKASGETGGSVELAWESLSGTEPERVHVVFDQAELPVGDPRSIPLPPHDPEALHFIRAELEFADDVTSSAEITFGGSFLDDISSELTAIPIMLRKRKKLRAVTELSSWFETHSARAQVVASEKGAAEIIVVRDCSSLEDLRAIRAAEMSKPLPRAIWRRSTAFGARDWTLRQVWPLSRWQIGAHVPFELFAYSQPSPSESGSLLRWLIDVEPPPELTGKQRLADAVAVAGVTASASHARRTVVLLLGKDPEEHASLSAQQARQYLQWLRVPLMVWSTAPGSPNADGWGHVADISTAPALEAAIEELFDQLDRQRIVWLTGYHLPHHVGLTPAATGVSLAY